MGESSTLELILKIPMEQGTSGLWTPAGAAKPSTAGQGPTGPAVPDPLTKMMGDLVHYGVAREADEAVSSWIHAWTTPDVGEGLGTIIGETAGNVVNGTIIGTAMIPSVSGWLASMGITAAIPGGAIVAGVAGIMAIFGLMKGIAKNIEKREESRIGYVQDLFSGIRSRSQDSLEQGIEGILAEPPSKERTDIIREQTRANYSWAIARQERFETTLDNAMGYGYIRTRAPDINENIGAYEDGGLANMLTSLNDMIGQGHAYQEKMQDAYEREALAVLLQGKETGAYEGGDLYTGERAETLSALHEEYRNIMAQFNTTTDKGERGELSILLEGLKERALAVAETGYDDSETSRVSQDEEIKLAAALRENTGMLDSSWNKAYALAQVMSGADPLQFLTAKRSKGGILPAAFAAADQAYGNAFGGGFAYGLNRVPQDNFPAMLHEGERVLTASQARAEDRGEGTVNITFSGPVTVREEADLEKIAWKLADKIQRARLLAVPR